MDPLHALWMAAGWALLFLVVLGIVIVLSLCQMAAKQDQERHSDGPSDLN
jgi:hypothetical protein